MRFTFVHLIFSLTLAAQTITTVAGNSSWGRVIQTAMDKDGNLYAADYDYHVVYKIDRIGATTIIAGTTGRAGVTGDGGLATSALLRNPTGTAILPDGSLLIADYGNDKIRKIAPSGIITTIAGTGVGGFQGDGGQASAARINGPRTFAVSSTGVIYFVDYANLRIRRIGLDGVITTVAGTGRSTLSGDGGLGTSTDMFPGAVSLALDGSLLIADDGVPNARGTRRVRRVGTNGIVSTVAGTGTAGFSGDGGPATLAQLQSADGVAMDSVGNIYISEYNGARIRKVNVNGIITTYAGTGRAGSTGDGGLATNALLNGPTGLTIDSSDNLYINDTANEKIRRIAPPPQPTISTSQAAIPSFLGKSGFGSNMYVEIYGSNLSGTTRTWTGADFQGSTAPTQLDGVSVTVNGKPAAVYFISPGQININTPEDTATGPVQIQVKNGLGVSNVGTAVRARVSPTLQAIPQFNIGGKSYVVAQTPDFKSFIGIPGMVAGVPFVEARPGDTVSLYALGCGPTNPITLAGVVAASSAPLALSYQVKIGGVPANVTFAGIAAGTVGLYQINLVIPNVLPGDQPIELLVDGISNQQGLVIRIGN